MISNSINYIIYSICIDCKCSVNNNIPGRHFCKCFIPSAKSIPLLVRFRDIRYGFLMCQAVRIVHFAIYNESKCIFLHLYNILNKEELFPLICSLVSFCIPRGDTQDATPLVDVIQRLCVTGGRYDGMACDSCQIGTIRECFGTDTFHITAKRETIKITTPRECIIANTAYTITDSDILQISTTIEFIIVYQFLTV